MDVNNQRLAPAAPSFESRRIDIFDQSVSSNLRDRKIERDKDGVADVRITATCIGHCEYNCLWPLAHYLTPVFCISPSLNYIGFFREKSLRTLDLHLHSIESPDQMSTFLQKLEVPYPPDEAPPTALVSHDVRPIEKARRVWGQY